MRFVLVGIVNTIFGSAIMFLAYNLFHFSYWISSAANYFFGSILSYFLNRYYTFKFKGNTWKSIVRFTLNILICYGLAYGIAKPLMKTILSGCGQSVQENVAMLVGIVLFVAFNYLGQRFYAFKSETE